MDIVRQGRRALFKATYTSIFDATNSKTQEFRETVESLAAELVRLGGCLSLLGHRLPVDVNADTHQEANVAISAISWNSARYSGRLTRSHFVIRDFCNSFAK